MSRGSESSTTKPRDYKKPLISIVIPTYNEKENIAPIIHSLHASMKDLNYKIIFIDDSSPDGTAQEILMLAKRYPVELILRPRKMGLGSAVVKGVNTTSSPIIVVMDADLQHDPNLVSLMVKKLNEGFDLVIASRKVQGGRVIGWSAGRKFVSDMATHLAHILVPKSKPIKDPLSGFFAFKRDILKDVKLETKGFKLLLEMLAKAHYTKTIEVPLIFRERKTGKSKLDLKEYILYISLLISLMKYK
ncbi:MAG: polyprenol monophosphomannose synthase [Thermoprotei archaeon]